MNEVTEHRDPKGRFLPGNPGGPGGPRPGSGRKPKPSDPTLLEKLYENLDEAAPKAMRVLDEALSSEDEKVRIKAAELILRKVLPDQSMLDLQRSDPGEEKSISNISEEERVALQAAAIAYADAHHQMAIRMEREHPVTQN